MVPHPIKIESKKFVSFFLNKTKEREGKKRHWYTQHTKKTKKSRENNMQRQWNPSPEERKTTDLKKVKALRMVGWAFAGREAGQVEKG